MANNSYTKNYADGVALTEAKLDTAYQSLKLDIGNTTQMTQGATAGQYLKVVTPGAAAEWAAAPDVRGANTIRNIGIKCTAATGALVFTLTTGAGSTPTASDPCVISFSSNGTTQATLQSIDVTSTKTFTLTASATLGTQTTGSTFVYLYALKTSTASAGVVLGVSRKGDLGSIEAVTTTAVSASADSYDVLYSTASITQIPMLLGWAQVARNSTGSWQTPTKVNLASGLPKLAPSVDNNSRNVVTGTGTTARAGAVAISNNCGTFTTTSSTFVDVTNLSVTITTTGRPVMIQLVSVGSSSGSQVSLIKNTAGAGNGAAGIQILRGTTGIALLSLAGYVDNAIITRLPGSAFYHLDRPAAGTYTYKIQTNRSGANQTTAVTETRLVAYEL